MSQPPIDPRERFAGVPDRWASAILAAINPDPARRPQTARAFAIMLAEATPGDSFSQHGTDIVRTHARELLDIGNMMETVRAPKPAGMPVPTSRYQIGVRLGAGGMAEVFRGTVVGAEGFARPVAVKRVLPGFSTVPQFAAMFVQEAQIASRLSHPNIVSVLDFDRDPDGRLFLVMEYVEGHDLSKLVETGPLPHAITIFVISEALRGLGHAHDLPTGDDVRGVVHRDVSPHNVLISWEGAVKVSDFGIAKAREATAATASTMIKGKPGYMSPEQANGEALDGRSDLFATGVMLWEILTGQRLFDGTTQETIAQVLFKPIPRPSAINSAVPVDLDAITMRLLARERSQRYPNAEAVIEDLARCVDAPRNGRSDLARLLAERFPQEVASRSSRSQLPARSTGNDSVETVPARPAWPQSSTTLGGAASQSVVGPGATRRRKRWWIAAAAVALSATAIIAGVTRSRHETTTPASTPSDTARTPTAAMLEITTDPTGATVRVDGISKGTSPLKVSVARGSRVVVDAELAGYQHASRTFSIASAEPSVTLALAALPTIASDAGVADAAVTATTPDARGPSKPPRRVPPSPRTTPGTFNPNEVGGD